jgi:manganese/zinc/iron transport system permease protein
LEDFTTFFSLSNANVRYVLASIILLGASAGLVGTFNFLQKKALVGETVAHSMLPGIAMAFMLTGVKDPIYLLIGAIISGWVSIYLMDYITNNSKVKADASLAIILTVFFGLGMMLLVSIQHTDIADKSGLDHYIFGKAAAMTDKDAYIFGTISIIIMALIALFYKELKLLCFNAEFSTVLGLPNKTLQFVLSTVTILTIATGIKAVGIILMAALLIIPPAAARFWTSRLLKMILLSVVFGIVAGVVGAYISYTAPKMPTGPWTVITLSLTVFISVIFAPGKGYLSRFYQKRQVQRNILRENVLKTVHQLLEKDNVLEKTYTKAQIIKQRWFNEKEINQAFKLLSKSHEAEIVGNSLKLTGAGLANGKRINRLHRLWEVYLTRRLEMKLELVHKNAETIEHLITPELEQEILRELELCDNYDPKIEIHQLATDR